MAIMTGQVKVTIEMVGTGDAPKKTTETADALGKVKKESEGTAKSVSSLKDRMGSLKSAVGPINLVRETFENLKSNMGLVGLAAGALITVVGALIDVLDTPRLDATTDKFFRLAGSVSQSTSAIYGLVQASAQLTRSLADVDAEIADIDARAADHLGKSEDAKRLREDAARGRVSTERTRATEDLLKTGEDAFKAKQFRDDAQRQFDKNQVEINHLRALIDMRRKDGLSTKLQEQQLVAVGAAQATVIVNLKGATVAYQNYSRSVDDLTEKLGALDRLQNALEKPRVEPAKKPKGGGGKTRPERGDPLFVSPDFADPDTRVLDDAEDRVARGLAADDRDKANKARDRENQARLANMRKRGMADEIRDFSAALSESIPGMSDFSGALRDIASSWEDVRAANDNAADVYEKYLAGEKGVADVLKANKDARTAETRGIIMSVGAAAMAGAEQIKNERLRAGILATIHLGLGTALMFVPGAQQEAFGHLAGAAILGSVALFGGASGGGSRSSSSQRSVSRSVSQQSANAAPWTINIFGGWYGTVSPQEAAASLYQLTRRGGGSGWVPNERAA